MSNAGERFSENNRPVQVDQEVLDSIRKSWLIPHDTGKLTLPYQKSSSWNEKNKYHTVAEIKSNKIE
jgi:hypothetical protein